MTIKPFFFVALVLAGFTLQAQPVLKPTACSNDLIKNMADSIKKHYADNGYAVVREASISMESQYEMSIMMALTQGATYRFFYIGDPTSRLHELRMFDSQDRQLFYQKNKIGEKEANIISFDHSPEQSGFYALQPLQINKQNKHICGYVLMFKRKN